MYNLTKNIAFYFLLCATPLIADGCDGNSVAKTAGKPVVKKESIAAPSAVVTDEQLFRACLKNFKAAAAQKNKKQLAAMINFPLQTLPQWSNDDLKASTVTPAEGLVSQSEYAQYENTIFSADALRLIPKSKEADLSEIEKNTPENYYKTIAKTTDKGSTLYELQQQYVQSGGKETSFGFVFGKVKGQYKIISYFSPWPVKG